MAVDMLKSIMPKTDRLNADCLFPDIKLVIEITDVKETGDAEQAVAFSFKGDGGRPWIPCLSMRRAIVGVWGADPTVYLGRRIKLYRDPNVRYGSDEVGGIRISHMSNMAGPMQLSLTSTRGKKKPYVVLPLPDSEIPSPAPEPVAAETIDVRALQDQGLEVAERGTIALNAWWKSIGAKGQNALGLVVKEQLKDNAKAADKKAEEEDARLAAVAAASAVLPEGMKFEDGEVTEDRDGEPDEVRDDG